MKYILSLTLLLFTVLGTTVAQDEKSAAELKNEGNAALKAKDYKTALDSYEAAIASWDAEGEEVDPATVYNTATCAYKLKMNDKAFKYYTTAQEAGYKGDACYYYQYKIHKANGNTEEMTKTLQAGIENFPNGKYASAMKKELAKPLVVKAKGHYEKAQAKLNARTSDNADQWPALKAASVEECDKAIAFCDEALAIYANDKNAKAIKAGCTSLKSAE
ncbi:tetratricopeptide repeat protein [Saccharicrinis aurantiacus]|uniref:tetratricopeptide repeat protein n=1 Tax=Saccharicrinis aurantiacus TaxID=1849719 RepID=UPI000950353F|nr:hypothetical protein [Saccharicrinis aurantiacus]